MFSREGCTKISETIVDFFWLQKEFFLGLLKQFRINFMLPWLIFPKYQAFMHAFENQLRYLKVCL